MLTRRTDPERLHPYRGRESYEQQSGSARGGRSAAFPQRDCPPYAERHAQPFEPRSDDYALDDDYSRTDYGPRGRRGIQADNQRFVNGGYAPPRTTKGYRRSDDRIHDEVCERLGHAEDLDVSEIEVEVREGEVSLRGKVADRAQKRHAEDLAAGVTGVVDVHNGLRLRVSPSASGEG
jgi:hypothetical protein